MKTPGGKSKSTTVVIMRLWRGSATTRRIATPIYAGSSLRRAFQWLASQKSRERLWFERYQEPATVVGVMR